MSDGLTDREREVMDSLVTAWNAFLALPVQHLDDQDEFRHGIHDLQRMIMVRPTRRRYPGAYTNEETDEWSFPKNDFSQDSAASPLIER